MNPKQMLDDKRTASRFGARLSFCSKYRSGAVRLIELEVKDMCRRAAVVLYLRFAMVG